MATIIVGGAVLLIVGLLVRKMIRDRKKGGCCGGDCASCHMSCESRPQ